MNITTSLNSSKEKSKLSLQQDENVKAVLLLQDTDSQEDIKIAQMLGQNSITRGINEKTRMIELEKLDGKYAGNVFTIEQIKELAKRYNLRFLNVKHYCGGMPVETIAKLKAFGKETNISIIGNQYNYFMLAPEKCFKLDEVKRMKKDPDPALFYKIDETHYRMVHQWGSDFTVWNRYQGLLFESQDSRYLAKTIPQMVLIVLITFFFLPSMWFMLLGVLPIVWNRPIVSNDDEDYEDYFHEKKWNDTRKIIN